MDCNNFFVSCERLFRPDLDQKPVLVLSSNDGCVVSRSQEVKDMGISMGVPFFQIQDVCTKQGVTAFSSNFSLYKDISSRVMSALRDEFSNLEVYSIDEAFFEIGDTCTEEELLSIRARIIQKTGIPVSIGVAQTKTLAKIAGARAKKSNGISIIRETDRVEVITPLSCGSVWGVGRQSSKTLSKEGIDTIGDFLKVDSARIQSILGVIGLRLMSELKGQSAYPLGVSPEHGQESITSSRSFGAVVHTKSALLSAVAFHCMRVSEKLRARGHLATRMTVIARASRFSEYAYRDGAFTLSLPTPTNDVLALTRVATEVIERIFDKEVPYKKAGIVIGDIVPQGSASGSLFDQVESVQSRSELNNAIDTLNAQFGKGTVKVAMIQSVDAWKEKRARVSKEYTTKWSDIPLVKAR